MQNTMGSTRPYLIRAFYNWIVDNQCTPHIVVNAHYPGVEVPQEFIENGQIVLNISGSAVQNLNLGDHFITFQARFGARPFKVRVSVFSILAIYARENGRGMVFAEEELDPNPPTPPSDEGDQGEGRKGGKGGTEGKSGKGRGAADRSHLKVVK